MGIKNTPYERQLRRGDEHIAINSITQDASVVNNDIMTAARNKLNRIIAREGDLGGERGKPEYLAQLVAEEKYQRAVRDYCMAHYKGTK